MLGINICRKRRTLKSHEALPKAASRYSTLIVGPTTIILLYCAPCCCELWQLHYHEFPTWIYVFISQTERERELQSLSSIVVHVKIQRPKINVIVVETWKCQQVNLFRHADSCCPSSVRVKLFPCFSYIVQDFETSSSTMKRKYSKSNASLCTLYS